MSDKVKKVGENTWEIEVQEDGKTKEMYIQLPQEALSQLGWHEDDTLEWEIDDSGIVTAIITKKGCQE